jgi:hypothetical protein
MKFIDEYRDPALAEKLVNRNVGIDLQACPLSTLLPDRFENLPLHCC